MQGIPRPDWPARHRSARLLERDESRELIAETLAAAAGGRGAMLVIEGAAGLGKSSLLAEAAGAGALRVLRTRGDELEQGFAWAGAINLLAELAREPADAAGFPQGTGPALALLAGEEMERGWSADDSEERAFALLHSLTVLLESAASATPLLLLIDDAHWIDLPTLSLLRYLLGRLDGLPVGCVIGTRPADSPEHAAMLQGLTHHPAVRHQLLQPLSERAVEAAVREALGEQASEELCRRCARLSAGNPFVLGELLRHLGETPDPERTAGGELELPNVFQSINARIAALGEPAERVAAALAVLGDGAPARRVAALGELSFEETLGVADRMDRAELLSAGATLSFAHPLVRSAVRAQMPGGAWALAHARAARLLYEEGTPTEEIAGHLLHAPAGALEQGVSILRRTAAQASERGAPAAAVTYLERAVQEPAIAAVRAEMYRELGNAAVAANSPRAPEYLGRSLGELADEQERIRLRLELGWALHAAGRPSEAGDAFATGREELGREGRELTRQEREDLATELEVGELTVGMLDAERAEHFKARLRRFESGDRAHTRAGRHLESQLFMGRLFSGAVPVGELAAAAEALAAKLDDETARVTSWTVWNVVGTLSWCDRFEQALAMLEQLDARARRSGSVLVRAMIAYARAWPALWTGQIARSAVEARLAAEIWSAGAPTYLPAAVYWWVTSALELGHPEEAAGALALVEEERWLGSALYAFAPAARARIADHSGEAAQALELWLAAGEHLSERVHALNPTLLPWRAEAAILAARIGDARAQELAGENLELARRFGASRALGEALRASGLVARGDQGVALLGEAVATLRDSGAAHELARALVDEGALLRRSGRPAQARESLREGLGAAEQMTAVTLGDRAREELTAAGGRPRRRIDQGQGARSLTTTERRVADLAVSGLSNRQIAERLFVTRKTVEWHLSRSYEKLDISGRGGLAEALREPV